MAYDGGYGGGQARPYPGPQSQVPAPGSRPPPGNYNGSQHYNGHQEGHGYDEYNGGYGQDHARRDRPPGHGQRPPPSRDPHARKPPPGSKGPGGHPPPHGYPGAPHPSRGARPPGSSRPPPGRSGPPNRGPGRPDPRNGPYGGPREYGGRNHPPSNGAPMSPTSPTRGGYGHDQQIADQMSNMNLNGYGQRPHDDRIGYGGGAGHGGYPQDPTHSSQSSQQSYSTQEYSDPGYGSASSRGPGGYGNHNDDYGLKPQAHDLGPPGRAMTMPAYDDMNNSFQQPQHHAIPFDNSAGRGAPQRPSTATGHRQGPNDMYPPAPAPQAPAPYNNMYSGEYVEDQAYRQQSSAAPSTGGYSAYSDPQSQQYGRSSLPDFSNGASDLGRGSFEQSMRPAYQQAQPGAHQKPQISHAKSQSDLHEPQAAVFEMAGDIPSVPPLPQAKPSQEQQQQQQQSQYDYAQQHSYGQSQQQPLYTESQQQPQFNQSQQQPQYNQPQQHPDWNHPHQQPSYDQPQQQQYQQPQQQPHYGQPQSQPQYNQPHQPSQYGQPQQPHYPDTQSSQPQALYNHPSQQHQPPYDQNYGRQGHDQQSYGEHAAYDQMPPRGPSAPPMPGTALPMPRDPVMTRPGTAVSSSSSHPTPVRPGLMAGSMVDLNRKPAPVRNYGGVPPAQQAPPPQQQHPQMQRGPEPMKPPPVPVMQDPVTPQELEHLRMVIKNNPNDQASALKLAKRLIEAADVLVPKLPDPKSRAKARERYVMDAHKILKKLSTQHYPEAMFLMADSLGKGLCGNEGDNKEAFTLYQSAAKLNHAAAAYRTAVCCEIGHEDGGGTRRDPLKAIQWYRRAATLGDPPAMYKMGMIQLKGLVGQPKNPREAVSWLKRAAERADTENPHALHELGLLYESAQPNDAIVRDERYAFSLFTQAAELGYKFSEFRLATAYEYGTLGCPIDPRLSIMWYSKAAMKEEHQSELALSGWYLTGSEGVLNQSDTEAYLWARKAAIAGLPKAEYAMGYFTEVGIGVAANLEDAKRWYWRAAAQDFPKARERLEDLKRAGSGRGVPRQRERISRSRIEKQQDGECSVM